MCKLSGFIYLTGHDACKLSQDARIHVAPTALKMFFFISHCYRHVAHFDCLTLFLVRPLSATPTGLFQRKDIGYSISFAPSAPSVSSVSSASFTSSASFAPSVSSALQPFTFYIFLRYCPPTSYRACVTCPSEQVFTPSINAAKVFPLSMATFCNCLSVFSAVSPFAF